LACLCALLLAGLPLAGQAAEDLGPKVRRLVRQLNAPEAAQRDAAQEQIIAIGVPALDLLPAASDTLPAEEQHRLMQIRQSLQRNLAAAAAQASLVTLHARAMPLAEVFAAISQQTGNKLVDARQQRGQPNANSPVTLELDRVPFWQALDRVLDQAGLEVDPFAGDDTLQILARGEKLRPRAERASYTGPFRIEATQIVAQRDLRNPANQALNVWLEIAWEPRVRPISIRQKATDLIALGDAGRPLAVVDRQSVLEPAVRPGTAAVQLALPLELPSRSVKQITQLHGSLAVLLPGRVEAFRFGQIGKAVNVEKRIAAATVTLARVARDDDIWAVEMSVCFDRPEEALESYRGWVFANEAYLEGPDGKPLLPGTFETTEQKRNEIGAKYMFDRKGSLDDYQFVYKTPVLILGTKCDYELKSIALP
jgi:hypothetical protein